MRWNGGKAKDKPVAFVGKGVVFDTGGISIKPAGGMEDMKGDMAGAAAVTGLMHALAPARPRSTRSASSVWSRTCRTARPSGRATSSPRCPADIEIINTDAEGRLVLADAVAYTETGSSRSSSSTWRR
jgi:leucyl aminopeptidase